MRRFVYVWGRLVRAARGFFEETGLSMSASGYAELARLLAKGTLTILQEGKAYDDEALREAEQATRAVLATASGAAGVGAPVPAPLGLYLGGGLFAAHPEGPKRGISRNDLRAALRTLCPIWPFCRRPVVAPA